MGFLGRFFGPPSKERFAKLFMQTLKRIGDDRAATIEPNEFRVRFTRDGKAAGLTNLENIYREYVAHDRKARAMYLRTTCIALAKEHDLPEDFEDARHDLRPTLKPRSFLDVIRHDEDLASGKAKELAAVPVSEHLVACLVYDLPHSMSFVTVEQLEK